MSQYGQIDIPAVLKQIEEVLKSINKTSDEGERDKSAASASGTRFVVHLEGLKLPEETAKKIESDIRKAVMTHIASLDLASPLGERSYTSGLALGSLSGTLGLIVKPTPGDMFPRPGSPNWPGWE